MISLLTVQKTQNQLKNYLKTKRLQQGLTQEGLAKRSGVSLPTLRKFEQKGQISLVSFLKLLMVLDNLDTLLNALKPQKENFQSINEVLKSEQQKERKKGWIK